jgi:hypothetical protein
MRSNIRRRVITGIELMQILHKGQFRLTNV